MSLVSSPTLKSIYDACPVSVQNLGVSLIGWKKRRTRYGSEFTHYVDEFLRRQWFDREQWIQYQNRALEELLDHAHRTVPHYEDLPNIEIDYSVFPRENMRALPRLSTDMLKNHPERLVSRSVDISECIELSTSGTTGTPKVSYHDTQSHQMLWAAMERFYRRVGCRHGDRRLSFTGNKIVPGEQSNGPFGRYDRANNRMFMSSYHLGPDTVDQYLDEIEHFGPHFIDGYPSSIAYCAKGALGAGRDIRIPACFPTAETLRPKDRDLIEEAFSTKVFNQYGSAESASLVTECVCGRLHVNPDIGIVEVVDEEGHPVSGDEVGELVLTGLNNRAMPLIRYQIGDLARGAPQYVNCECGWETPVINELIGREDEMVVTTDGRQIPMLSYNVFKYASHVEEAQIVQNEVDRIDVKVVPDKKYTEEETKLIKNKVGEAISDEAIDIQVKLVDDIPKTESGKFRAVVCDV